MKKLLTASIGVAALFVACSGDDGSSSISTNNDKSVNGVLVKDGYFTDSRDGNKYKIIEVNGSFWFAENLRYLDSAEMKNLKGNVWCYDDDPKNCDKYGALYSWSAALDLKPEYNSKKIDSYKTYGVCPDGWEIPTFSQWKQLFDYVDNWNGAEDNGTSLKSLTGWEQVDSIPAATNRLGFNALAAGRHNSEGGFLPSGKNAFFWSLDEVDEVTAKGVSLRFNSKFADHGDYYKEHGMSVRCIAKSQVKLEGNLDSSYIKEIPQEYGSVKIDDEKYKTVQIGAKTWMAENLNLETGKSWCYNDESSSCDKFGRLYDWETAKTVCPDGWRLPSKSDFSELIGSHYSSRFLRSNDEWKDTKGLNFWGFNAFPAGAYNMDNATFFDKTISAYFWSSEENAADQGMAYAMFINYADKVEVKAYEKQLGYSVRCVKD